MEQNMTELSASRRAVMTATLAAAATGALAATPAAKPAGYRAVFQVSDADPKKWNLTLNNVKNVQEELGADNITVEIVAYGPGLDMLLAESEVGNRVLDALQAKVAVLACENTMTSRHLKRDDMVAKIGYVKAGVAQLIKRQAEGYAYIRA
jgi:intracellular sulfur oxidation DsrE/DsrF family protein